MYLGDLVPRRNWLEAESDARRIGACLQVEAVIFRELVREERLDIRRREQRRVAR